MAALFDFRFVVRKATFIGDLVILPSTSKDVFIEDCAQMTYADAQMHLAKLSVAEVRSHSAILSLKYREDKKPRGWVSNPGNRIDFEAVAETPECTANSDDVVFAAS